MNCLYYLVFIILIALGCGAARDCGCKGGIPGHPGQKGSTGPRGPRGFAGNQGVKGEKGESAASVPPASCEMKGSQCVSGPPAGTSTYTYENIEGICLQVVQKYMREH